MKKRHQPTNPDQQQLAKATPLRLYQSSVEELRELEKLGLPSQVLVRKCLQKYLKQTVKDIGEEMRQASQTLNTLP
jgi:hypothetical protein